MCYLWVAKITMTVHAVLALIWLAQDTTNVCVITTNGYADSAMDSLLIQP